MATPQWNRCFDFILEKNTVSFYLKKDYEWYNKKDYAKNFRLPCLGRIGVRLFRYMCR